MTWWHRLWARFQGPPAGPPQRPHDPDLHAVKNTQTRLKLELARAVRAEAEADRRLWGPPDDTN